MYLKSRVSMGEEKTKFPQTIKVDEEIELFIVKTKKNIDKVREFIANGYSMPLCIDPAEVKEESNELAEDLEIIGIPPQSQTEEPEGPKEPEVSKELTIQEKFDKFYEDESYLKELFVYDEDNEVYKVNPEIDIGIYEDNAAKTKCPITYLAIVMQILDNGEPDKAKLWLQYVSNKEDHDYWLAHIIHNYGPYDCEKVIELLDPHCQNLKETNNGMLILLALAYQIAGNVGKDDKKTQMAYELFSYLVDEKYDLEKTTVAYEQCIIKLYPGDDSILLGCLLKIYNVYPEYKNIEEQIAKLYFEETKYEEAAGFYTKVYDRDHKPEFAAQLVKCYARLGEADKLMEYALLC